MNILNVESITLINVDTVYNAATLVGVDSIFIHQVRQQLDRMFPSGWYVSADEMATIAWPNGPLYSAGWYSEPANI